MNEDLRATELLRHEGRGAELACTLNYDGRFLRRRRLLTDCGMPFVVDLAKTTSLNDGDALVLDDGRHVAIKAAAEELYAVSGPALIKLAWHVGNRHTPCQIEADRLLIQRDPVMRDMLIILGATVNDVTEPFTPEGGAYGHGRTHGHDHSATHSDHAH